jgi:hypothetical protein
MTIFFNPEDDKEIYSQVVGLLYPMLYYRDHMTDEDSQMCYDLAAHRWLQTEEDLLTAQKLVIKYI